MLLVRKESKFNTFKEMADFAKANPGKVTGAGTAGLSDDAISFFALKRSTGADYNYVPFAGGGEVVTALLGGHVDFAYLSPSEAQAQIEAGKVKALATTSGSRLALFPNSPTYKELGVPVELAQNRGVVAPKGIPADAKQFLQNMLKKVSETPEWKDYIKKSSMVEKYLDSDGYTKFSNEVNSIYADFLKDIK
ncbi:MAG: hypothetical protein K0R31_735 [Clostridiales bacterium]|nr:hypothetical protein [Clostridiales bacterium]